MGWELLLTDLPRGETSGRTFSQSTVRIGRNPDCELILKHSQVSRLHLTLSKEGEKCFAEDSSSNGTFLKDGTGWQRLQGKTELQLPTTLRLADWTMRVDYEMEADWDRSVIIPAGHLAKKVEAILVFDLCESSKLANQDDQMALHLKNRLMQIAEPLLNEYGKTFIKSTGDGFLATLASPAKALVAAVELERRIQARNAKTDNAPIHYRIALHHGDVWGVAGSEQDIHGNDINITFRIEGVQAEAFPNASTEFPRMDRVLCSASMLATVSAESLLPSGFEAIEIGAANLKGIADPTRIVWLKTR